MKNFNFDDYNYRLTSWFDTYDELCLYTDTFVKYKDTYIVRKLDNGKVAMFTKPKCTESKVETKKRYLDCEIISYFDGIKEIVFGGIHG